MQQPLSGLRALSQGLLACTGYQEQLSYLVLLGSQGSLGQGASGLQCISGPAIMMMLLGSLPSDTNSQTIRCA